MLLGHPLRTFPAEAEMPAREDHRVLNVGQADEALVSLLLPLSVEHILKAEHFLHVVGHTVDHHLLLQDYKRENSCSIALEPRISHQGKRCFVVFRLYGFLPGIM